MNIGNNIKQFREIKNLSQDYLANELNISQSSYAKIESGAVIPKIDRLQEIAKILEVEVSALLKQSNVLSFIYNGETNYSGYIANQNNQLKEAYEKTIESLKEEIIFLRSLVGINKKN